MGLAKTSENVSNLTNRTFGIYDQEAEENNNSPNEAGLFHALEVLHTS